MRLPLRWRLPSMAMLTRTSAGRMFRWRYRHHAISTILATRRGGANMALPTLRGKTLGDNGDVVQRGALQHLLFGASMVNCLVARTRRPAARGRRRRKALPPRLCGRHRRLSAANFGKIVLLNY